MVDILTNEIKKEEPINNVGTPVIAGFQSYVPSGGTLESTANALGSAKTGSTTKDCSATTTTTIAHGLGVAPSLVILDGKGVTSGGMYGASAYYSNSAQSSNSFYIDSSSGTTELATATFDFNDSTAPLTGTITVDATNITITWAGNTFTSTAYLIWTAFA